MERRPVRERIRDLLWKHGFTIVSVPSHVASEVRRKIHQTGEGQPDNPTARRLGMSGAGRGLAAAVLGALLFLGGALALSEPTAAQTVGVCDRTSHVRDEILNALPDRTRCEDVTSGDLASIESLSLRTPSLQAGDFASLTGLKNLTIREDRLTSLPPTVFNGLSNLEYLYIHSMGLRSLPANLFNGLRNLQELYLLGAGKLGSLPANLLNGLGKLWYLSIRYNSLSSLPPGFFAGLDSLREVSIESTSRYLIRPRMPLDVSLTQDGGDNCFQVRIAQGAPIKAPVKYEATVRPPGGAEYTVEGGGTILVGRTESANICVPLRAATSGTKITVSLIEPSFGIFLPSKVRGLYYTEVAPLDLRIGAAPTDSHAAIYVGPEKAEEGTDIEFPVRLSSSVSSDVTVRWKTEDGSAEAPGDYDAVTDGTLTIKAGETSGTIVVKTVEDDDPEGHETLKVKFDTQASTLPSEVVWGNKQAEGNIGNDDTRISVLGHSAKEGTRLPICYAELSHEVVRYLSFPARTTPGTAGSADYWALTSIPFQETSKTPNIPIARSKQDDVVEGDETFTFTVEAPHVDGMTLGVDKASATCTIEDDDKASVSIADAWAYEGDDVTFAVSMSAKASSDVILSWATQHDTTQGHDYDAVTDGTLTIRAGKTSGTIEVEAKTDTRIEGRERFKVLLSPPAAGLAGGVSLDDREAIGTIWDRPAKVTLTATVPDNGGTTDTLSEDDDAQTVTVTAELDGRARFGRDRVVWVSVGSGTAAEGTDFATTGEPFGITIPAGATSATGTFTLDPKEDLVVEGSETVALSGVVRRFGSTVTDGSMTVTAGTLNIADTTAAPEKIVLTPSLALVLESSDPTSANVTVTATVQGDTTWATPKVVTVVVGSGTATEGTDFKTVDDFDITIPAGATSATGSFTLDPEEDVIDEGTGETVAITGSTSASDTVDGTEVTITDNDTAPTGIALTVSRSTVSESADPTSANVTVTAKVQGGTTWATSKVVTVVVGSGTATEGTDFKTVDDFDITIPAGASSAKGTFTLDPTDDNVVEGNETVAVSGTLSGVTVTGTSVTITDTTPPRSRSTTRSWRRARRCRSR